MSEYVPTTPEVNGIRNGWACAHVREDITPEVAHAAFDRWLAETIREAKAEAWDECSDEFCKQGIVQVPANPYAEEADHEHRA